ncbi:MAG: IPExxxVDY family protein [Cytophagales bacterium]|nr:IPExxxVDY family protein [Cytophagales bacterium]
MKKQKLVVDFDYNFKLFGIISPASEHKLAWELNRGLNVNLIKNEDIKINFLNNKNLIISNFLFGKEESILRLLKNKSVAMSATNQSFLIPELKQFDYLLIIDGFEQTFKPEHVAARLRQIDIIQNVMNLEVLKLKSKENLVF